MTETICQPCRGSGQIVTPSGVFGCRNCGSTGRVEDRSVTVEIAKYIVRCKESLSQDDWNDPNEIVRWCFENPAQQKPKATCVHSWMAQSELRTSGNAFRCCHCGLTLELR